MICSVSRFIESSEKRKKKAENRLTWVSFSACHVGIVSVIEIPAALESIQYVQVIACVWCIRSRRFPCHGDAFMIFQEAMNKKFETFLCIKDCLPRSSRNLTGTK